MQTNNTLTLNNYFDEMLKDLNRFAVGFEPTFRNIENIRHLNTTGGFPPYDLEKISDTEIRLSMAVAGYSSEDLSITSHDGTLTIEGKVSNDDTRVFLHKGIAGRSFRRVFYLDQWIIVVGSTLANGILTIDFKKELPEALKPRKIEIKTANNLLTD